MIAAAAVSRLVSPVKINYEIHGTRFGIFSPSPQAQPDDGAKTKLGVSTRSGRAQPGEVVPKSRFSVRSSDGQSIRFLFAKRR
jgi:hypothetical protein